MLFHCMYDVRISGRELASWKLQSVSYNPFAVIAEISRGTHRGSFVYL
jgi:hypothetical protein